MQHGKPVITTNIGAMQSIIDHNINGILVEPGNVVQLKIAIENLYKDDKKCIRLGIQGKKKALQDYDTTSIYKCLIETYTYAINTKK
jgi:glycosyltransferase involved in cell wall biosynthesis